MRIRFRGGDRCGHCGTQHSSSWFSITTRGIDLPLSSRLQLRLRTKGVDHRPCGGVRQYTAATAPAPEPTGP
ncbi:MAG: hypothetical protein LC713_01485, partial [Actinobacteria bacterium]|nr:hypothetical protein [Actinomycetota bacterium]